MAKYLRPRRGSKANAVAQKILLKKGEMFMEFPNSEIGKGPGRIIMGDGATSYQNMDYGTTATNVFRPFITDPEIFIPHFANTNPSTASWTVDAGTAAIAKMGDGSSASTVALPTIIGAVKETLCKHADSITKLNNDLGSIGDSVSILNTNLGNLGNRVSTLDEFKSLFDGYVSCAVTLGGDVITTVKGTKQGITYFENSNQPTHRPSGCDWGAYVVFRHNNVVSIIYMDEAKFACTRVSNITTATSITWKVI